MSVKKLALLIGPFSFLVSLLIANTWLTDYTSQITIIGILIWMLVWWITQAIPIGVTALLPMVLFPLTNILTLKATTANYASPIIYLFFGGFVLGIALEKWNLHKRIALNILKVSGNQPKNIVLGSMLATALMSMWISNTATTVMMLPIGISIVGLIQEKLTTGAATKNFALALMLGIAYAANLGGMATLIGTPPNLVLASLVSEAGLDELGFASWMLFALPLVVGLFFVVYLLNTRVLFPMRITKVDGIGQLIQTELKQLGRISLAEKRVLAVLLSAALLWIIRGQLNQLSLFKHLSDPLIAILAAIALFIIPANGQDNRILTWQDMQKMPWGILLLFGGGISLAKGMEATELVLLIGDWISGGEYSSLLLLIAIITLFSLFLTEVMSNVALVSVFVPVSFVIAQSLGVSEIQLAIPLTLAASCAFMFPISTPPNAIVFGSGFIQMNQMARAGIWLNLISVALISVYCYYLIPLVF